MQLRRNEILTGLLVLSTVAVLVGTLILLGTPGLFRPLTTYRLYFDNAAGIKLGALNAKRAAQMAALALRSCRFRRHAAAVASAWAADLSVTGPESLPFAATSRSTNSITATGALSP